MDLENRNCVLKDEDLNGTSVHKHIFQDYSKEGCLLECRAKMLDGRCGCLPYYFPDFSSYLGKNNTCNMTQLQCLSNETGPTNKAIRSRHLCTYILSTYPTRLIPQPP